MQSYFDDLCDPASAQSIVNMSNNRPNTKRSSEDALGPLVEGVEAQETLDPNEIDVGNGKRHKVDLTLSEEQDNNTGLPLYQLVDSIRKKGRDGLGEEYATILRNEKPGTLLVSSSIYNMKKNRYINIKCYDKTRVILEPYDLPEDMSSEDMDYINASYVDGYNQPRAYISTQGPIESTIMDFWRMIWQTGSRVIVMVTLNIENETLKCERYWPSEDDPLMTTGVYTVEYINSEEHKDFIITQLQLTNTISEVSRTIWHLQFISWPDFGTPQTAAALLKFREQVLRKQSEALESASGNSYLPIVVHCSAGVGRSGTFITVDTCIQEFETTGLVHVRRVVEKLREQRYLSIQTKDQYIFCYKAVVEYAASCGLFDDEKIIEGLF